MPPKRLPKPTIEVPAPKGALSTLVEAAKELTPAQANVVEKLGNTVGRLFLTVISGVIALFMAVVLAFRPSVWSAGVEAFFAVTVTLCFRHYFGKGPKPKG